MLKFCGVHTGSGDVGGGEVGEGVGAGGDVTGDAVEGGGVGEGDIDGAGECVGVGEGDTGGAGECVGVGEGNGLEAFFFKRCSQASASVSFMCKSLAFRARREVRLSPTQASAAS